MQRPSPYFLFGRREHEKVWFSLHSNPAIDSSDFIEFHPPYEKTYLYAHIYDWSWNEVFQIVGSVNGLICLVDSHGGLHEKYYLWNLSINRTVRLPFVRNLLSAKGNYRHGFGYHTPTNEIMSTKWRELCILITLLLWLRFVLLTVLGNGILSN